MLHGRGVRFGAIDLDGEHTTCLWGEGGFETSKLIVSRGDSIMDYASIVLFFSAFFFCVDLVLNS